jgi:hypothetical protein
MVHRGCFDSADLDAIESAFEAAWITVEIHADRRDKSHDERLKEQIRQKLFEFAEPGKINPEQLCEQALLAWLKD